MGNKKIVRQSNRRTIQEKLDAALSKKPTVSYLNSKGIPAEELKKIVSNLPEDKKKLVKQQKEVKNGKNRKRITKNTILANRQENKVLQKLDDRPVSVKPVYNRQPNEANLFQALKVPEWFNSTSSDIDVSIIVPCFKSNEVIQGQIASWDLDDDGLKKEIIYVDDACPLHTYKAIMDSWQKRTQQLHKPVGKLILNNKNVGFGQACNIGASHAKGKYLVFLNADTTVTKNWIKPLYDLMEKDNSIGILGNLHLRKDGNIDSCGSEWDWKSRSFLHIGRSIYNRKYIPQPFNLQNAPSDIMKAREVDMVTGACFMISNKLFNQIEGFDPEYRVGYWEDADLCMKVKSQGLKIYWTPESTIYHKVGHTHSGGHAWIHANSGYFYRKWVETKIIDGFLNENRSKKIKVDPKKAVVYTAITNGYDNLKEQPLTARTVDFVAFLEKPVESQTWKCAEVCKDFTDPNRNAKIHKIMPHLFFPDKEYSLWIDGSVNIEFNFSIEKLIEIYLSDCDMALFKHPDRNCIYQEANACIQRKLDNPEVIRRQIEKYTREGYPSNAGLSECTILLRRHTPQIIKLNEMWWNEIKNGSKRDQISFNYVARKLGIELKYFPGHLRKKNYFFAREGHNKSR